MDTAKELIMIVSYTREGTDFQLDTDKLPLASVEYLLQYGFAQSLQDTIAGLAKAKESELRDTDQFKSGNMTGEDLADEVSLALLTQLEKRKAAIEAGTIGVRVGQGKADDITVLAREQVRDALRAKGKKIDTKTDDGKALFARLVEDHKTKNADKLKAEIARRAENTVDVELDI